MNAYIAIVIIGFLVYLTVVAIVNANFLQPITRMTAEMGTAASGGAMGGLPTVSNVPVDAYREVFFHSALIQGLGSGLIAGKLAENEALAGLKYGIALVLVTTGLFVVL
jgi:flagellar protein FlaJ